MRHSYKNFSPQEKVILKRDRDARRVRRWRTTHPGKVEIANGKGRERGRQTTLKKHKMTEEDYGNLKKLQGGGCSVCGAEKFDENGGRLAIDHNHQTGEVRGLLCRNCNAGLGLFRDDPFLLRMAIIYLCRESHV